MAFSSSSFSFSQDLLLQHWVAPLLTVVAEFATRFPPELRNQDRILAAVVQRFVVLNRT